LLNKMPHYRREYRAMRL